MKTRFLFSLLFAASFLAAQQPNLTEKTQPRVQKAIEAIEYEMGREDLKIVAKTDATTQFATINSQSVLLFKPEFVEKLSDKALLAVVAHELGHRILNHEFGKVSRENENEIKADDFAGKTMAHFVDSEDDALSGLRAICPIEIPN